MRIPFLICLTSFLISCSYFSSNISDNRTKNIINLKTDFIIIKQDTISFSNSKIFDYCILQDNIGRKFMVLEDGCLKLNHKVKKEIGINDTINIEINLTKPERFYPRGDNPNMRGPCGYNFNMIVIFDNNIYTVFETRQLCNNSLIIIE